MSTSMTPVVLVSLPNLPYLLGTFDTTNFRQWWRSAPFPDDLEEIKKGFHIYGRTHLAIAKRKDGRWAIYRSKNYGIDWERVFLAASGETIYDLVLITFGRAIMNTSLGFYETVNAGTSWSLVLGLPSAPTAPAFCNIGGGDVLMCTDGRYIWRSTNIARAWTQVCDQRSLQRLVPGNVWITYTGLTSACIAGANGYVVCGFGPHMTISEDAGLTWFAGDHQWEWYVAGDIGNVFSYPNPTLVWDRFVPVSPPQFVIRQIIVSSINGISPTDVTFLLRYDDLFPMAGQSQLYSRTFASYPYNNRYIAWKCIYQQYISPGAGSQLSAYDLPITGSSTNDKLAFSAQTRYDTVQSKYIVSLKYSTDGGVSWIDIDVSNITVGNADDALPYAPGSTLFLDDSFAKITWIHGGCDNVGDWDVITGNRRQCLSYEMDAGVAKKSSESYQVDGTLLAHHQKSQDIDAHVEAAISKPYDLDVMAEGLTSKSYQIDRTLEGLVTKSQDLDAICVAGVTISDMLDVIMWANPAKYYHLDIMLNGRIAKTYLVDAILVKDRLNEKLSTIEREMVQFLDIDVPSIPYAPLDSRQETL